MLVSDVVELDTDVATVRFIEIVMNFSYRIAFFLDSLRDSVILFKGY